MITELGLRNFKCFRGHTKISFRQVNLLTGINGRGKSTTLQSLLLMRQSPEYNQSTSRIILNGSCVNLGEFDDIRSHTLSRSEPIELTFRFDNSEGTIVLSYLLVANEQDDMVADIKRIDGYANSAQGNFEFEVDPLASPPVIFLSNKNSHELLSTDMYFWNNLLFDVDMRTANENQIYTYIQESVDFSRIHYVSADRIGPQDYYPKQSFSKFVTVGSRGEFTANVLAKMKNDLVNSDLCLELGATHTILDQAEAWLHVIFGGGKLAVEELHANIVLMTLNAETTQNFYKPVNVGFGYSYALPIIVSGLIANSGEMLIVENPEAHLHPYAQSQLAKFLAKVSATGIQVFIESHSDHVLNALRVAVLDKVINHTDLNILYFDRNTAQTVEQIPVNEDGSIEYWPVGFFDQTDKDFERLFGV